MTTSRIAATAHLALVGTITWGLTFASPVQAEPDQTDPVAAAAGNAKASMPAGDVVRAAITNGIDEREPVDQLEQVKNDHATVYFFTELRDLTDQEVRHRWTFNGQVMAEVPFQVRGSRWRVWSTKQMDPIWLGSWQVDVVASDGRVLESRHFDYVAAETADSSASPTAPPAAPALEQSQP